MAGGMPRRLFKSIGEEVHQADEPEVQNPAVETPPAVAESPSPEVAEEHPAEVVAKPGPGRPRKRPLADDSGLSALLDEVVVESGPQVVRNGKQRLGLYLDVALMDEVRNIVHAEKGMDLTKYTTIALRLLNSKMAERRGSAYPKRPQA